MFTIDQITNSHSKVESGADFPYYIQELIALGVHHYQIFVVDGHAIYEGRDGHTIISPAKYPEINISDESDAAKFTQYLKTHQLGETDYLVFCGHAADTGVYKWIVDTKNLTCSYYDKFGNILLTEMIPDSV